MIDAMPDTPRVIAILDDEASMRTALRRLLRIHGYDVALFENAAALLNARPAQAYDCIVLDLHMPGPNGFSVLETLKQRGDSQPIIVLTGNDQPGVAERVGNLGACAYLSKPVDEAPLLDAIESALRQELAPPENC